MPKLRQPTTADLQGVIGLDAKLSVPGLPWKVDCTIRDARVVYGKTQYLVAGDDSDAEPNPSPAVWVDAGRVEVV